MKLNLETIIQETQVKVRAKVNQTEDPTKVENSILNMVKEKPTVKKVDDDFLEVEGNLELLSSLKNRILKNEQEELVTSILERNRKYDSSFFFINKQSAYNNSVHLIDESLSTLGDLEVIIFSESLDDVINWFTL